MRHALNLGKRFGIPIVTALPTTTVDGDAVLLKLGVSPFEFILLHFNSAYGKWISSASIIAGNGAEAEVTTTTNTTVTGMNFRLINYKYAYDAGLRVQTFVSGRYRNSSTGSAKLHVEMLGGTHNVAAVTSLGTTTGVTSPSNNATTFFEAMGGWEDFSASDPGADTHVLLRMIITAITNGTAGVTQRAIGMRYVSA